MNSKNIFSSVIMISLITGLFLASSQITEAQNYGYNSATGNVKGRNYVGGLAGRVADTGLKVHDSYARGSVEGAASVGGLAGQNGGLVENSYATGKVTGTTQAGGLAGSGNGTVTGSYWDRQTTGKSSSAGGLGRDTDPMTYPYASDTYSGWDFTRIWKADPAPFQNSGYPLLKASAVYRVAVQVFPPGAGTVSGEGIYPADGSVELEATPGASWKFKGWFAGSETVGLSENLSLKVTNNVTLVARFVDKTTSAGVGFAKGEFKMELYPNPAQDFVRVRTSAPDGRVTSLMVMNANGQKVMHLEKESLSEGTIAIPLTGLSPGIYLVVARFADSFATAKLVKY